MKPLHISVNGVFSDCVLDRINVNKSSGPDRLPERLLQCLPKESNQQSSLIDVVSGVPQAQYWAISYIFNPH